MFQVNCLFSNRFCKQSDENKKQKVALILEKLITMTIEEVEVRSNALIILDLDLHLYFHCLDLSIM